VVAETLRAKNVKGVRNTVRFLNPLIRHIQLCLQNETLDMDLILRDRLRIIVPRDQRHEAAIPQPVLDFLVAFNSGCYSDLELDPKKC